MMSYNKSPLAFDDIQAAFEQALNAEKGIRIVCRDRGAAVVLRSRFNYYRKLDRDQNRETYQPDNPMWNKSVYDKLVLRIPPKGSPEEAILYIERHSIDGLQVEVL